MRPWAVALLVAVGLAAAPRVASAQYPPIEDRDYAIDLYQGPVLGSARVVGMGGASVAAAEGSVGMMSNPAAPAVRPATSVRELDWDFHFDWLYPDLGSDFDNNGIEAGEDTGTSTVFTAGIVGQAKEWALGLDFELQSYEVGAEGNPDIESLHPQFIVGRIALARTFFAEQLTVGLGLRLGVFSLNAAPRGGNGDEVALFQLQGAGLELGGLWRPAHLDLRLGASSSLPVQSEELPEGALEDECDPLDCQGYILPDRVVAPWRVAVGGAWRFAATRWNRKVHSRWRDERSLVVAADVVLTGPVDGGAGMESFVRKQLQPSGDGVDVSVRVGAELEWLPGRLRLRGGSYWEPSRFEDVDGRLHATFGVEVRVWEFCLDLPLLDPNRYRLRLSLTADGARDYANVAGSIGFWR